MDWKIVLFRWLIKFSVAYLLVSVLFTACGAWKDAFIIPTHVDEQRQKAVWSGGNWDALIQPELGKPAFLTISGLQYPVRVSIDEDDHVICNVPCSLQLDSPVTLSVRSKNDVICQIEGGSFWMWANPMDMRSLIAYHYPGGLILVLSVLMTGGAFWYDRFIIREQSEK